MPKTFGKRQRLAHSSPGTDPDFEFCFVILRPASFAGRRIYESVSAVGWPTPLLLCKAGCPISRRVPRPCAFCKGGYVAPQTGCPSLRDFSRLGIPAAKIKRFS
jgi:hypothetical protein